MNRDFTHFGFKHKTFNTNNIAAIEEFFENIVVQGFIFSRTNFVTAQIKLNSPFTVL